MKTLFEDNAIKQTRANSTWKPQVRAEYLLDHFERLTAENYVPTPEDILIARQRTTGQTTTSFVKDKWKWELIDMGGQESERDKWDDVFNLMQVNAVIYLAALDEYNVESNDKTLTTMQISMNTFEQVMNEEKMKDVTRILFLNKADLLERKIDNEENYQDFLKHFPEYTGVKDPTTVKEFLREKFLALVTLQEPLPVQAHFTCALDTRAMDTVFEAVRSTIMIKRLQGMGMVL